MSSLSTMSLKFSHTLSSSISCSQQIKKRKKEKRQPKLRSGNNKKHQVLGTMS